MSATAEVHKYVMPETGFIRQRQLIGDKPKDGRPGGVGIIPFSATTLWVKVKKGEFPKPEKISKGITAWRVEDIRRFIAGEWAPETGTEASNES